MCIRARPMKIKYVFFYCSRIDFRLFFQAAKQQAVRLDVYKRQILWFFIKSWDKLWLSARVKQNNLKIQVKPCLLYTSRCV